MKTTAEMTLGSLFDGIAGFPLAARRQGIKTVWVSEIEPDCIDIAKRHFPEALQESERTQEKKKVFPYPKTLWRGNAYSYGGFSKVIRGGYNGGVYPGSNGNNANYFQGNADCK